MNLLIDSHVVLWWFSRSRKLSVTARTVLADPQNRVYVSAAVAWELAIKVNLAKLDARSLVEDLPRLLFEEGFRRLAIAMDHALRAGLLPRHHNDPFDRMLVAQAQALNCPIVSADNVFDSYAVRRIW
ncbi:MAG TPA: type II toxin-antitoxin system VapC family toxin [Terriglobales bacterium]|jgi:PIN domain nuclease of toxin-antitoxin system